MGYHRQIFHHDRNAEKHSLACVLSIMLGMFFFCTVVSMAALAWTMYSDRKEKERQQNPEPAPQVCEDGESCFLRGYHYYKIKEYDKAALDWEKSCDLKYGLACTNRGFMDYYRALPEPSPERALDFAARGCAYNDLKGCQLKGDVLRNHFSQRPGALDESHKLYVKACSPKLPSSCGYAAADFYLRGDYEKSYEFAARGCRDTGGEDTVNSCLYRALAAEKTGRSEPPRENRIKTIKEGCDKYELGYVCAVYAQEIAKDDRERLAYMDKACHFHGSPGYCNMARQARQEVTNTEARQARQEAPDTEPRLPELQEACAADDREACLRVGKYYENNNELSPRERTARAIEVYEALCQKRDSQGCAELRRLKKDAGR